MTDDDKYWFLQELKNFAIVTGKVITVEQREVYWHALKDLRQDEMKRGFKHLMDTWSWPRVPYPADFRKAAKTAGWHG
jgi:hypothetical protein